MFDEVKTITGKELKDRRVALGMSRLAMCKELHNCREVTLWRWEKGKTDPKTGKLLNPVPPWVDDKLKEIENRLLDQDGKPQNDKKK